MNNDLENIAPIEQLTKYFANEATAEERSQVESWRDSNKDNHKEFNAVQKLWNLTGTVQHSPSIDLEKEWRRVEDTISPVKTRTLLFSRVLAVAASVAVISILVFLGIQRTQIVVEQTQIAETKQIKLPDGSNIYLNANTKISYKKDFGKFHRNIKLKGEAFFDVVDDKDVPFIISANEASIEVVGTQFNVKAYKKQDEIKVTVSEGTVKLYDKKLPKKETFIKAGETGKFNKKIKSIEKIPVNDINDIAWKTRIINFSNTPLSEVAEILENTYHVKFTIDDKIKNCAIDVQFTDMELTDILKVIKSTLGLTIQVQDNTIIISGSECKPV
jgi:ferric-dicitrate binding protein FerR (iron transport regulator)